MQILPAVTLCNELSEAMQQTAEKFRQFCAAALCVGLASCGGGSTSDDPIPIRESDSGTPLYSSTLFVDDRLILGITFPGGLMYVFYQSDYSQPIYPEFVYAGFFVGRTGTPTNGKRSYAGIHYDFETQTSYRSSLDVQDVPGSLDTTLSHDGKPPIPGYHFWLAYNNDVSSQVSTSDMLTRSYRGTIRSIHGGTQLNSASIDVAGNLSAGSSSGCVVSGSIFNERPTGNLYDARIRIGNDCMTPAGDYRGHALQSFSNGNVYVMATSESEEGVFIQLFD